MDGEKSLWEIEKNGRRGTTIFLAVTLVVVLMLASISYLYSYVFIRVQVKGASMENTLFDDDIITVNVKKTADYGDIIVIKDEGPEWIIKRLIAKGGDEVMISQGYVFVNGEKLVEPYVKEEGATYYPDCADKNHLELFTTTVKEGEVFYLGDNRKASSDSRNPFYSTTSVENIVGVVTPFHLKLKNFTKKITKVRV